MLLGFVALAFLPDRPERTRYFSARERALAIDRMNRETSGDIGLGVNRSERRVLGGVRADKGVQSMLLLRSRTGGYDSIHKL